MLAILGGLGAAVAWAVSTLCSSRSSRMIDPASVVGWVAIVGLLVMVPFVAADGVPAHLDGAAAGWLALAGAGNVAGLLVAYAAYRSGDVVLIAPLIATEGAIAALIAIVAGEGVSAATAALLAVIAAGVSLAAVPGRAEPPGRVSGPGPGHGSPGERSGRILLLAGVAAICFGLSLYATGHVSGTLPLAWVVLPARLLGVALVALPLIVSRRLRFSVQALPLLLAAGLCEVLGVASFTLGARHDVAVAAVISCQFAALSALAAYFLFKERIGRVQVAGVVVLLLGVSILSAIRG